MKKPLALLSAISIMMIAFTGCSAEPSNEDTPSIGFNVKNISNTFLKDNESGVNYSEQLPVITEVNENGFVFVDGGSGSCPPEIEQVTVTPLSVNIEMVTLPKDKACTMDFQLYAYKINLNDKINPDIMMKVVKNGEIVNPVIK